MVQPTWLHKKAISLEPGLQSFLHPYSILHMPTRFDPDSRIQTLQSLFQIWPSSFPTYIFSIAIHRNHTPHHAPFPIHTLQVFSPVLSPTWWRSLHSTSSEMLSLHFSPPRSYPFLKAGWTVSPSCNLPCSLLINGCLFLHSSLLT